MPNQKITADTAQFAVLEKKNIRTYVAYNPNSTPKVVTFSDGMILTMPPNRYAKISQEVKP